MTPLLPEKADELQDLALDVIQKSVALGNRQHPVTLDTLRELLRIVNSTCAGLSLEHTLGEVQYDYKNDHPIDSDFSFNDVIGRMQR
jgi:hypothetical protein